MSYAAGPIEAQRSKMFETFGIALLIYLYIIQSPTMSPMQALGQVSQSCLTGLRVSVPPFCLYAEIAQEIPQLRLWQIET